MYENKSLIPDWDTFRLVLAIDRFGGISGAAKSLGVTRKPRFLGEGTAGLTRLEFLPWERYFPIWVLTHPELRSAARVKTFMRFISSAIAERRSKYYLE